MSNKERIKTLLVGDQAAKLTVLALVLAEQAMAAAAEVAP